MDLSLRDIEMSTINLTPDKVTMQGDTVLVQYIVQSWELQKYEGVIMHDYFKILKFFFRWHSRTNQTCLDFEKENHQWDFNNLLTNSTYSCNCVCYKFLQTFLLRIYNIHKPDITASPDNPVHLSLPISTTNSLCQDDWYLAYLCSTYSIFRGQGSIYYPLISYLSRFFSILSWMLWEMMMTEK